MMVKSLPILNQLNPDKHIIYQERISSSAKFIYRVLFRPVQYRKDFSLTLVFLHYSAESTSCVLFLPTIQHLVAEIFSLIQISVYYSAESTSCVLFFRTIQHLVTKIFSLVHVFLQYRMKAISCFQIKHIAS